MFFDFRVFFVSPFNQVQQTENKKLRNGSRVQRRVHKFSREISHPCLIHIKVRVEGGSPLMLLKKKTT